MKTPKICGGRIRVNVHRPLDGTFKFARLVLRPSGWYVQCITDYEGERLEPNDKAIDLDMGITYLAADSNGGFVRNSKSFRASAKKLAHAQKRIREREGMANVSESPRPTKREAIGH